MTHRTWIPVAIALAGAATCATMLHLTPDRRLVAALVPVWWLWGMGVVSFLGRAPSLRHVLAASAVVRFVVVGVPPWLSDDVFRYLFEGLAVLSGHNPLYESPGALAALDPTLASLVNHAELSSVYPPLALAWFAALHVLGGSVTTAQGLTALADLGIVAGLSKLRPQAGWVYALLPLPVMESAAGAHIDVPAIALATLGMVAWTQRPRAAWGLVVAGALTKLFPLVLLPTMWRAASPRHRVRWALLTAVIVPFLALPFVQATIPPGLLAYGTSWSFNGLAYTPLSAVVGASARPALLVLGTALSGIAVWRLRTPLAVWAAIGAAFVALSPTMHPWYALWALVPALALGIRGAAAAAVFVPSSYLVLATYDPATATWSEGPWLWTITWLPVLACLAWGQWSHRQGPQELEPQQPEPL